MKCLQLRSGLCCREHGNSAHTQKDSACPLLPHHRLSQIQHTFNEHQLCTKDTRLGCRQAQSTQMQAILQYWGLSSEPETCKVVWELLESRKEEDFFHASFKENQI